MVNTARNFLIMLKKYATNTFKTASKSASQKTAETTGDLNGNKISNKITKISKT